MASSAMKADALRDAHRLHTLRDEITQAGTQGGPVEIPPSYALRLSVTLHEYRENLCESDDMEGAESVAQVIQVIDGKIAGRE
ncbi:hypothetical protein [Natronorubrum aibiense]|nr:hypothetical protein [Natronorubrum aibiense]